MRSPSVYNMFVLWVAIFYSIPNALNVQVNQLHSETFFSCGSWMLYTLPLLWIYSLDFIFTISLLGFQEITDKDISFSELEDLCENKVLENKRCFTVYVRSIGYRLLFNEHRLIFNYFLTGLQSKSGLWIGENRLSVCLSVCLSVRRQQLRLAMRLAWFSHKPLMIQQCMPIIFLTRRSFSVILSSHIGNPSQFASVMTDGPM